jgi:hypothetical protein
MSTRRLSPLGKCCIWAIPLACLVGACGGGRSQANGSSTAPTANGPRQAISTNPAARHVDADCALITKNVRSAVQAASSGSIDQGTASRVVTELTTLDNEVAAVRAAYAGYAPDFRGSWRAQMEVLLGDFQAAAYPNGSMTPQALASEIVRQSQIVSDQASVARIPDCATDPAGMPSASNPASGGSDTTGTAPPTGTSVAPNSPPTSSTGPTQRFFRSPSGNIECELDYEATSVPNRAYCQTQSPAQSVTLSSDGSVKPCSGVSCLGNGPDNESVLSYGRSTTLGPFRCTSTTSGMTCLLSTGQGFEISRSGVARK